MNALTLWNPWAWAMAHAGKPVENRTWEPPSRVLGQLLAIHAGKTLDHDAIFDIADEFGVAPENWDIPSVAPDLEGVRRVGRLVPGAIVAVGVLAGFVRDNGAGYIHPAGVEAAQLSEAEILRWARQTPWYQGPVGWVVVKRIALPTPVPCKGAQGLWTLPPEVEAQVRAQIGEAAHAQ